MSYKFWGSAINDYEKLLETGERSDVIIYVGENEEEFRAHSAILCIRSEYFRAAFSNNWAEKKDGMLIFKKPNIESNLFRIILRFIYCGDVDLTKLQGPEVLKLLIAVDELDIQLLISCIQEYLTINKSDFLYKNPIEILEIVYQHEKFTDLWSFCLDKICEEPEKLINSDKFINLKAPLLELLLKRDDFALDEVIIWEGLIKWGLAQNPTIPKDVNKWSKEQFTIMERTLHRFIPL
ncbi:BTB/POZ protein, partial [Rhizophagus diaphanus]